MTTVPEIDVDLDVPAALSSAAAARNTILAATSCSRYDRAELLLRERPPKSTSECFAGLRDSGVRMGITAQHTVLEAATDEVSAMPEAAEAAGTATGRRDRDRIEKVLDS